MHASAQKEQFSLAYVHAVASVAGYNLGQFHVDDDSVDVTLKTKGVVGSVRRPHLNLQLKCTQHLTGDADHWSFNLKRKNYDDLRYTDLHVPNVLVVMLVPDELCDWLVNGDEGMTLHRRAYWLSLKGRGALPPGQQSVTVHVPRRNVFDVPGLVRITEDFAGGLL